MEPGLLILIAVFALIGACAGTFTGMVPGIHVNTAATLLLGVCPSAASVLGIAEPETVPVLTACCIFSAATVHSFVAFVPSVFIGAPDPDDSLSVLPAHRLLSQGRGMVAVRSSAIGSVTGAMAAIPLAIPLQWIMLNGGSDVLGIMTSGVLTATLIVIILVSQRPLVTAAVSLATGLWGCIVMGGGIPSTGMLGEGTLLFPMLTGLFGMPPLLESRRNKKAKSQHDDGADPVGPVPGLKGVATGLVAGWFPGITSTVGATLASAFGEEREPERFIALVSSINTVTAVFSLVTLSVTGSGRSGTAMAVKGIIGDSLSGFCSDAFVAILFCMAVAAAIGYSMTVLMGKAMAGIYSSVPSDALSTAVIVLITTLVLLTTGPWGLVVLALSTFLGYVPPSQGISRTCLACCLMIPALLSHLGIDPGFGTLISI
ncbi:MAG: hypothetical protein E7Z63_07210 [Thermoplasmata archaeon]|nr:hypothetical protein [Thermoplasmata archaeon]